MNRVQRLTRVNCTIEREQTDDIHFFSAGECTNQARTLLPRFFAVLAVPRIRTRTLSHVPRRPGRAIDCPSSDTQYAVPRARRSVSGPLQH
jgi:hypothetical protein